MVNVVLIHCIAVMNFVYIHFTKWNHFLKINVAWSFSSNFVPSWWFFCGSSFRHFIVTAGRCTVFTKSKEIIFLIYIRKKRVVALWSCTKFNMFFIGIFVNALDCEEGIILYVGKIWYVIPQTDSVFIRM